MEEEEREGSRVEAFVGVDTLLQRGGRGAEANTRADRRRNQINNINKCQNNTQRNTILNYFVNTKENK